MSIFRRVEYALVGEFRLAPPAVRFCEEHVECWQVDGVSGSKIVSPLFTVFSKNFCAKDEVVCSVEDLAGSERSLAMCTVVKIILDLEERFLKGNMRSYIVSMQAWRLR